MATKQPKGEKLTKGAKRVQRRIVAGDARDTCVKPDGNLPLLGVIVHGKRRLVADPPIAYVVNYENGLVFADCDEFSCTVSH
jgi:hypothetical protein